MKILFLLWLLANAGNSVSTNLVVTDINNANLNYLWGNLSQIASQKSTQLISASEECVNGLLDYLSPKILNLSNYAGLFSANCSVFFDRVLEKVECEIAASNTSLVNNNAKRIPGIPLPARYMSQLTLSHILMTQIAADWRVDKYQQQINHLWLRQNPCTASKSDTHSLDHSATDIVLNTDTQDLPLTETEQLTPSWLDTLSNTLLATKSTLQSLTGSWSSSLNKTDTSSSTASLSPTKSPSGSKSFSETVSRTSSSSASASRSISVSQDETISKSLSSSKSSTLPVVWNPEWANWDVTTGVYKDATNQTGRYNETVPGVVIDLMTGLQWQKATTSGTYNWTNASAYCDNLLLGGFADWRLSTAMELQSLVDYTNSGIGINDAAFPNSIASYYWTSTAHANNNADRLYVNFALFGSPDIIDWRFNGGNGYLRCVRPQAAIELPIDRYRNELGNTLTAGNTQVLDLLTGLIWQRAGLIAGPRSIASGQCSGLNLGGVNWRVPTIKELSTLSDRTNISWLSTTAFPTSPLAAYWSATPPLGWSSIFAFRSGDVLDQGYTDSWVRCVRSANLISNPQWANWEQSTGVYQDATNQTGRYIEPRPEIVKDTLTGLQWQKSTAPGMYNWTAAKAYCDNLFLSGYGDWRLPTCEELLTLVDYTIKVNSTIPAINITVFPNTPVDAVWSSTPVPATTNARYVHFFDGSAGPSYTGVAGNYYVRCVRPLSAILLFNRYANEMGSTLIPSSIQVKDTVTGLIWQRGQGPTTYTWSAAAAAGSAQAYCNALTLAGQLWRLPDIKELSTLLDMSVASPGPTINISAFPGTSSSSFWTSTSYSSNSSYAWYVNFEFGKVLSYSSSDNGYVRCVRTPVIYNPEWANWNRATGVYADATNQPSRYQEFKPDIITDTFTGLEWEKIVDSKTYNWTTAKTHCDNLIKSGTKGWRLPTRVELQSLVDYTISYQSNNPGIKNDVFPDTPKDYFWSSTPVADNSSLGWYVNFGASGANTYAGLICYQSESGCSSILGQGYARCIRPQAATFLENRYRDENGNILITGSLQVKDMVTALIWQRVTSGTGYTWSATNAPGSAQAYCNQLVIGTQGAGSWRLPNIKELETLTTIAASNSSLATINTTAFPLAPSVAFWSSSSVAGTSPSLPLYVPFNRGGVYFSSDANPFHARCVRP